MSRSGSIAGEKSRSRVNLKKDISMDEGDALKKISEEVCMLVGIILIHNGYWFLKADKKLHAEKRKTDEARKYLHQKRHQEQAKFSDEETEVAPAQSSSRPEATSTPVANRKGDVRIWPHPFINCNYSYYCSQLKLLIYQE